MKRIGEKSLFWDNSFQIHPPFLFSIRKFRKSLSSPGIRYALPLCPVSCFDIDSTSIFTSLCLQLEGPSNISSSICSSSTSFTSLILPYLVIFSYLRCSCSGSLFAAFYCYTFVKAVRKEGGQMNKKRMIIMIITTIRSLESLHSSFRFPSLFSSFPQNFSS